MKQFIKDIVSRYLGLLAAILVGNLLYSALLPLTLYPVYIYLKIFFPVIIQGNSLVSADKSIEIVRACIGTSAVLLLLALNLATPSIKSIRRVYLFLYGLTLFLLFNWARIFLLSVLYLKESFIFNQIHIATWYFGSTVAVVAIWLVSIKIFKIKETPFISDAVYLAKKIR